MTRWKYDTDPHDPLAVVRVPVTSKWPVFPYLVALHKEGHRPTAAETSMLVSFLDYRRQHFFNAEQRREMERDPFDTDPTSTTVIFHKYQRNDWGYRLSTWPGSMFAPPSPRVSTRSTGPLPLGQVMDLVWSSPLADADARWLAWKQVHSLTFPETPA